ncbi:hypothetical protein [Persicitalea jodogahamensis]|uniref:Uncharacterized protein n=1 Tax=Persicitalea jodogahamensis TaxID=402147 RepID=A0A8J3D961_9BACT|nr:hypothetical protein [Persicitalea jodogahamensis]GHB68932.1 hypothetical protein GCM10007390_23030 [Persicitalea jodogahamensis]
MEDFFKSLTQTKDEEELIDFCRKNILHGTPKIFINKEGDYYDFRKRISNEYFIDFHEVYITGSAKLGFSPYKRKEFDLESDIDVTIVSVKLYERIMNFIQDYQLQLRESRKTVSEKEIKEYHKFLEYTAIGWMRPDLLPISFRGNEIKSSWFQFFQSISYGRSEVGNYKVTAGVFKSHKYLERYIVSGIKQLKKSIEIEKLS